MGDNSLEVSHTDGDVKLLLDLELLELEGIDGDGGLEWLLENL